MSTVTVSLQYPNGITAEIDGTKITFNGWNSREALVIPRGDGTRVAITSEVPEEFWKKWLQINKDHPLHVNGLISAQATESRAKAEIKEKKGVKSGLEALDKNKTEVGA